MNRLIRNNPGGPPPDHARSAWPAEISATGGAFTLIELLVVLAIIAALAGLLLPTLGRSLERARVVKVHAELANLGLALEMYAEDAGGNLPPTRVNCNSDLLTHWCEFPVELSTLGYVPRGSRPGMAAEVEDVFNRGHTYKYIAPGPVLLNGQPGGNQAVWVPEDFPLSLSETGQYHACPKSAPVRWAIWSTGPRPESPKSLHSRAPLSAHTWYRRVGDGGVLVRFATRDGTQLKSP
jgi:prepilin-type N-terminal cleavage/methylation domain-containing protein